MSPHVADGLINFATFFVPAILLALADRVWNAPRTTSADTHPERTLTMYPGHFAAGLALKTAVPRAPTFGLMIGVGLLDLIFGVLVGFGIEGGGFRHLRIPWSHSLLMSLGWSVLFAACFWRWAGR